MPKTCVYVDGFNLYYRALRGTPFRWLDLAALCRLMLPSLHIDRIQYFTARVARKTLDSGQPIRQQTYLRALGTLPSVRIHYGHFLSHPAWMPLATPLESGARFVRVIKTEEKGSDVNLATQMISDAYEDTADVAVLITNDSDLLAPMKLVRDRLGKRVGVLCPSARPARMLATAATFLKPIRSGVLRASQFADELADSNGTFRKPAGW